MRSAESCCRHDLAAFRARLDGYSASTPLFEALTTENTEFETPLSADFPTQLVLHKTHDNNNVSYVKIFLLAYSWFLDLLTIFPIWCGFDCVSAITKEVFFDFYESLWIYHCWTFYSKVSSLYETWFSILLYYSNVKEKACILLLLFGFPSRHLKSAKVLSKFELTTALDSEINFFFFACK